MTQHILETQYKQREYDGKWMSLGKVHDPENAYIYQNDNKQKITLTPTKWIVTGVYDLMMEFDK